MASEQPAPTTTGLDADVTLSKEDEDLLQKLKANLTMVGTDSSTESALSRLPAPVLAQVVESLKETGLDTLISVLLPLSSSIHCSMCAPL